MNRPLLHKHKDAVANLLFLLGDKTLDVIQLGRKLVNLGIDNITDGFWIWNIDGDKEYYSPEFRKSLGFDNEKDFPNVPESWQKQILPDDAKRALDAYELHIKSEENPYFLRVTYRKKSGGLVKLICAGTIVNRGANPRIMIGTHEIIT